MKLIVVIIFIALLQHSLCTSAQNDPLSGSDGIDTTISDSSDSVSAVPKENILLKLLYRDSINYYSDERIAALYADLTIYEGRVIRNITVRRVDMFALSIEDTSYIPEKWLQRTGNSLHTDTREKILRRNLLINEGEQIEALLLSENERIIRGLSYIMDARFLVRAVPGDTTSVDVELLVKDLWPIAFGTEIRDLDIGNIGLWNVNILGLGHQFRSTLYWNANHKPLFGYDLYYGIANMYGSFIRTRIEYRNRWNINSFRLNMFRNFKTTGLAYAGAVRFESTSSILNIVLLDTTLFQVDVQFTSSDVWAGRSFLVGRRTDDAMSSNIYLSGGASFINFSNGPNTDNTYLYKYQDKTQLLFSLAFSRQGFVRDNHIYTFERTEDVPFGYLFEITSGMEWGQYKMRPYISGSISGGNYMNNFSYLYGTIQYGTFFHQGVSEHGALKLKLRYFTKLHSGRNFDFRGFASLSYQHAINHYKGEFISLENNYGIKGLTSPVMRGDEKVLLNLESVIFSPYRLLGFRFVFFASADMGLIWNHNTALAGDNFFSGMGIGVRIRNDKLVFNTFEIKFTFYPGLPEDASARYFEAGSVSSLSLSDFYPAEPSTLKFQPGW